MRRSLARVFVAVSALVALAFVIPLGVLVRTTAEDRAIDFARAEASAVMPALVANGSSGQLRAAVASTEAGATGRMTVVTHDGLSIGPDVGRSDALQGALAAGASTIVSVDGGKAVVAAVADDAGRFSAVRIFVPHDMLRRGQWAAWTALVAVAVTLVGLSVVVADRLAMTVVRPTEQLAVAAKKLGAGDMAVRVELNGPPELVELSRAFNDLAGRVSAMLVHEREIVAELSHRLRTPMTALSMRLDQVADPEISAELRADVDRLTAVVDQLIAEARRRPGAGEHVSCDAARVVAARVEFWSVLAQDQERSWKFERAQGSALVSVGEAELVAALDVLIENVFAHTPEATALEVWVRHSEEGVCIGVGDDGPGFDPSLVAAGRSGADSTGLGLAIARRTAERAGGHLSVVRGHRVRRTVAGGGVLPGHAAQGLSPGMLVEMVLPEFDVEIQEG